MPTVQLRLGFGSTLEGREVVRMTQRHGARNQIVQSRVYVVTESEVKELASNFISPDVALW